MPTVPTGIILRLAGTVGTDSRYARSANFGNCSARAPVRNNQRASARILMRRPTPMRDHPRTLCWLTVKYRWSLPCCGIHGDFGCSVCTTSPNVLVTKADCWIPTGFPKVNQVVGPHHGFELRFTALKAPGRDYLLTGSRRLRPRRARHTIDQTCLIGSPPSPP